LKICLGSRINICVGFGNFNSSLVLVDTYRLGSSDTSATSASLVVQSLLGEDWTSNTSDDSSPLMWPANLTDAALLH